MYGIVGEYDNFREKVIILFSCKLRRKNKWNDVWQYCKHNKKTHFLSRYHMA